MGGQVMVESQPGTGSCFSFELGLERGSPAPAPGGSAEVQPAAAAAATDCENASDQQHA